MAIFGGNKETKEEKQARKAQELLEKYGLQELSDPRDLESVKSISLSLAGNGLLELGTSLSAKSEDLVKMSNLSALVEQNWIIIRQLDRLNKNLEK